MLLWIINKLNSVHFSQPQDYVTNMMYLLHGDGRHYRGQLGGAPALHHHHGLFHLQLVVEGDELRLGGAFACDQPPLHVGFIEAVQPESSREITHYLREQKIQSYRVDASQDTVVFNLAKQLPVTL